MANFRKNAAVVVFRADKKVLVCARINGEGNLWQFPQGGIEAGETTPDGKFFPDCLWCVGAYGLLPVIMIKSL